MIFFSVLLFITALQKPSPQPTMTPTASPTPTELPCCEKVKDHPEEYWRCSELGMNCRELLH